MKLYFYHLKESELAGRRRYSKDRVMEGEVVAYSQTKEIYSYYYGTSYSTDTGLLEIESHDVLPSEMKIYQPTDYEISWARGHAMIEEYHSVSSSEGLDLLSFLIGLIEDNNRSYFRKKEQLFALPFVVKAEDYPTFSKDIWMACKDKIGAIGLNYNKEKTELFTLLIAEAMIIGSNKSQDECVDISSLLCQHWLQFSIIYSLFYGRNITTGHTRFIELLSYMLGKTGCEQYLHLMLIALGDPQQKVEKIMRYSPAENSQKLMEKITMIQRQKDLVEQSDDLDELFKVLFPSTFREHLMNDNPYASIEEMMADIKESQVVKDLLKKVEEYADNLKEELGRAITIVSLRDAIMKCDPSTSRAIFAQLDMVLEGNNEVWDKYRKGLKEEVNLRYENHQGLLEGAHTVLIESNHAPISIGQQNITRVFTLRK